MAGAARGGVPGGDGMFAGVAPVQGFFGSDGVVVMHGVGADLFLAVYLHGEPVARVEHAARAVPTLADARLRCAPGLRLAALHAKGDAGYLKGVLSFGQPGIIRQLVLRAGSRCKEYRSYGKKYLNGMSFLHIALFRLDACAGAAVCGSEAHGNVILHLVPCFDRGIYLHILVADGDFVVVFLAALELAVLHGKCGVIGVSVQ